MSMKMGVGRECPSRWGWALRSRSSSCSSGGALGRGEAGRGLGEGGQAPVSLGPRWTESGPGRKLGDGSVARLTLGSWERLRGLGSGW